MKVILSRKGFDSKNGGQPSPILPDGTLLSLPIPLPEESLTYRDIRYNDKTYFDIIKELRPKGTKINDNTKAHLDPDLCNSIILPKRKDWKPAYGQSDSSQSHLENQEVKIGDLFLFYGWFKENEYKDGKLKYKTGAPDLHVIYGYLQIGEICNQKPFPLYLEKHPDAKKSRASLTHNCIYVASDFLNIKNNIPGSGYLKYDDKLILTKEGFSRSKWKLEDFFKKLHISYHNKDSFTSDFFQSAAIGQEFVCDAQRDKNLEDKLQNWAQNLIKTHQLK